MTTESGSLVSSMLDSYEYDDETGRLDLTFASGGTYTYGNVPPEIVEGLKASASPGGYWRANIKGRYPR